MRENRLQVHYTSESVQITLTQFPAVDSASAASAFAVAPRVLPGAGNQCAPERHTEVEEARDSKLGTWLLATVAIFVATMCNPNWVPSVVAQTMKFSKQLSADIRGGGITAPDGTAVADTREPEAGPVAEDTAVADTAEAEAGLVTEGTAVQGAPTGDNSANSVQPKDETAIGMTRNSVVRGTHSAAPAGLRDADHSAALHYGTSSGVHRTIASILVPPPPPTPCVLPPELGFFPMQPAQQHAGLQQLLRQEQALASSKFYNQTADREATPKQPTAASGRTEGTQSDALVAADKELQAAMNSSLHTVGEWTR
ncbi:MAG: hypothetical protein JST89_17725 [Cyanobacteria bacterium SZAS-4]|nr:hypothetical protein [Cyanobacteria bacterium SZAS-4]